MKYCNAVREQTNYEKYKGNKYKVLAAARNYFAGLMLAAGYHEDLKTAATLALKNCKKQEDGTYPLTECVIVMIGDDKVTYKEQGYWSEVLLKKPTLIKKYYDTINKNKFDQNYLAKNFLNDQKVKFDISNKKIVKNNSQEEFKPKKTNQDNEAPVIEIAEVITVNDTDYEFQGKVTDQAKTIYVEVDGRPIDVKNGKFIVKGYSPIDKQISIEAIDQWGNRSEPKIVKLNISDIANIYIEEYKKNYSNIIFNSKIENNIVHNFDQSYIDIIFNNLFKNSIEALKDIKNPQIELLLSINDNKLKLIFFDNGPGYEGDVKDLFKPYFSTKTSSGLGLSLINKIVNENNGDFVIKTNKYSGFKVEIYFNI